VEAEKLEVVNLDFGKNLTSIVEFDGNYFSDELNFNGHQIYFVIPPNENIAPSNVILFELIWLSS